MNDTSDVQVEHLLVENRRLRSKIAELEHRLKHAVETIPPYWKRGTLCPWCGGVVREGKCELCRHEVDTDALSG